MQITILKAFGSNEYTVITKGEEGAGVFELRCREALQWDECLGLLVSLLVPRCSDGKPLGGMAKLFLEAPPAEKPQPPSQPEPSPAPPPPDADIDDLAANYAAAIAMAVTKDKVNRVLRKVKEAKDTGEITRDESAKLLNMCAERDATLSGKPQP